MILLISPKFAYATKRLAQEAARAGIGLHTFDVAEAAARGFNFDIKTYDTLIIRFPYPYFDQIIALAKEFLNAGKRVVDAAIAEGDVGLGKWHSCQALMAANIAIPRTNLLSPGLQGASLGSYFSAEGAGDFEFPVIIKWIYGFKGREVFLAKNESDISRIVKKFPARELLVQEFIAAEYEYKVMTAGYRALPSVLRFRTDPKRNRPDFKKAEVLQSPSQDARQAVALAEAASRATGREMAKVDILQKGDRLYVLEVNRWPGFESFERLSGYNVAKDFISYAALPARSLR